MRSNHDNPAVLVLYIAMAILCAFGTISSCVDMTSDLKNAEINNLKTANEENMLLVNIDAYDNWYRHAMVSPEDYRNFSNGKDVNVIIHCYDHEYIVKSSEIKSIDILSERNVRASGAELLQEVLASSKYDKKDP